MSMISSLDGSTVIRGRSGPLGNDTDAAVLRRLRTVADVVVVGAGTVTEEDYGPPRKSGQRIGVITASGRIELDRPLFRCGAGFVITTAETRLEGAESAPGVDVVRAGRDRVDLHLAIAGLDELCGRPDVVLAEGGPRLNGSLLDADLVDELDVTTSSRAVGGDGPRLTVGASDQQRSFELAQLAVDDDSFLYARWRRRRS
jgi:riboflavin biosynthesis pyrimidine reductase